MFLGWKINDPTRTFKGSVFRHEHAANLDVLALAAVLISKEIRWECLLEHQGDALAHDAEGMNRIH